VVFGVATLLIPPELRGTFGTRETGFVGLFYDRNMFGRVAALLALSSALLAIGSAALRIPALVGGAVAVALLAASRSVTPSIALAASVVVVALVGSAIRLSNPLRRAALAGATAVAFAATVAFVMWPQPFVAAVGRDPTLSGRTRIWAKEVSAIRGRANFGYGYAAYWASADAPTDLARSGHNGFLDLTADLGWTGALLFVIPAAVYARRAVAQGGVRGGLALWPAAYLAFFFTLNVGESVLVKHKIYWALYVAAVLSTRTTHRS
jgi:O-antigen ligase